MKTNQIPATSKSRARRIRRGVLLCCLSIVIDVCVHDVLVGRKKFIQNSSKTVYWVGKEFPWPLFIISSLLSVNKCTVGSINFLLDYKLVSLKVSP